MEEKNYIFLTVEGYTYQPGSESVMPDVENAQMLGIAAGSSQTAAFRKLVADHPWLRATSFDEVFCYELAKDYRASRTEFSLDTEQRSTEIPS